MRPSSAPGFVVISGPPAFASASLLQLTLTALEGDFL
jgi:hypothetical protein